jgi:hypothetical protein
LPTPPTLKVSACIYTHKVTGYTIGNVKCDMCPCELSFDFKSTIRNCDTLIPAITSVDEKHIFAR